MLALKEKEPNQYAQLMQRLEKCEKEDKAQHKTDFSLINMFDNDSPILQNSMNLHML